MSEQTKKIDRQVGPPAILKQTAVGVISLLCGAIIGIATNELPEIYGSSVQTILYILIAICALASTLIVTSANKYLLAVLNRHVDQVSEIHARSAEKVNSINAGILKSVRQKAMLVDYDIAYRLLARRILRAREDVCLVTRLTYDFDASTRNFDTGRAASPERKRVFEALATAIRNDSIEYTRIFQVEPRRRGQFSEAVRSDHLYAEEIDLIFEQRRNNRFKSAVYLTDVYTSATFVIVDGTALFFNIEMIDPETNISKTPFILYVEDLDSEYMRGLVDIVRNIRSSNKAFDFQWDSRVPLGTPLR
jgi:hypothetical protein